MATEDGIDIHEAEADFLTRWGPLLEQKFSAQRQLTDADADRHAVAEWPNFADDFVIACQRTSRLLYRGEGSPEGEVAAPPGAMFFDVDESASTGIWRKATGTGDTGWIALGGGYDPGEITLDLLETIAANTVLGNPTGSAAAVQAFTCTAAGRALIDDASAAAQLTTLGVSAFVQTVLDDADGGAVMTTLGISAFAQTILDDANAATVRATIGAAGSGAIGSSGLTIGEGTVLGRNEAAGTGAVQELAPEAGVFSITGGDFLLLDGGITNSKIRDSGARSLVGRAANSSGDVADISGAGSATDPQIASDDGTSVAFRTLSLLTLLDRTIYEVNFASLANNTLAAGSETIDGLSWTVAGDTFLGTFDILNGTGLRMIAGTSLGTHSTWTSATQDAPYLYLPLSSLTRWDGVSDVIIDLYIPTLTLEQANEYVFAALWVPAASPHAASAAKVRKFTWLASGGNVVPSTTVDTTQTNGTEVRAGQNVLSMRVSPNSHGQCAWGTWSSGWPAQPSGTMTMTTSATGINTMLLGATRLVIGCGVLNDASPTTTMTIERLRVRRAA